MRYGVSSINSGDDQSFTVGSKSTKPSAGGFWMRSLAVWGRSLSSQEVESVFLAGEKTLSGNTMVLMVLCIAVMRNYEMIGLYLGKAERFYNTHH